MSIQKTAFTGFGLTAALTAFVTSLTAGEAKAVSCLNDNDHNCWRDVGTGRAQVAVGHSGLDGGGQGLVCSVTNLGASTWGGDIQCLRPVPGTTLSVLEVIASNIVSNTEHIFRARSLAIEPRGNGFRLHVLRNDNYVFYAEVALTNGFAQVLTNWWYAASPQLSGSPSTPVIPREIQWSPVFGLVAVAENNRIYMVAPDFRWQELGVFMQPVNTVYLGSGMIPIVGTNGLSHVFSAPLPVNYFQPVGAPPPPMLPLPLQNSDPNQAYYYFGRTTPVSCDDLAGCFVTTDVQFSPLSQGAGPAIFRSTFSSQQHSYTAWDYYPTGAHYNMTEVGGVWSVVAASSYRGIVGELFAIGGSNRLFNFVP